MPGDRHAVVTEAGPDEVVHHRAVVAAADVVLTGPDHLDRRLHRHGDLHRLAHEVGVSHSAPAEAAAEEHGVELHLVGREAGESSGGIPVPCLHLRSGPDVATVGADVSDAVEGLHGRVGKVGNLIDRLDPLGGGGQGPLHVAPSGCDHSLLSGQLRVLLSLALAVKSR